MRNKKFNLSTIILALISILFFVLITVLTSITVDKSEKIVRQATDEKLETGIEGTSSTIYNKIDAADKELLRYVENKDLIDLLQYSTADVKGGNEKAQALVNNFNSRFKDDVQNKNIILNEYVMNEDGIIYASMFSDAVGLDCSDRSYFKRAMNQEDLVVDDVVYSDRLNANCNMISKEIVKDGKVVGVIAAVLNTDFYGDIFQNYADKGLEGFIIDNSGNYIYNVDKNLIGTSINDVNVDELKFDKLKDSGNVEYKYNGNNYIAEYDTIPGLGWKVFIKGNSNEIFSSVSTLRNTSWLISIIGLIISVCIAYYLAKKIQSPIRELTEKAKMLAEGDLTVKISDDYFVSEISELADSFNTMVMQLSQLITNTSSVVDKVQTSSTDLCAS